MSAVTPQERKWTVMIYLAGDNNLSEECVYNLTEAKQALPENYGKLEVLAQFDPAGVRGETYRYRLRKNTTLEDDAEATGWKAHETNTGEPHNLLDFLRWGTSQFEAEHYLVILAGHGSGTDDDFLLRDENPPDALSIAELRYVFEQLTADGQTIDVLGFDTCLMNMAEVCFELLRTNVTYMVGSEGYSPNTGWPYKEILKKLSDQIDGLDKSEPNVMQPLELAKHVVQQYKEFYEPYISGGISVDQSVLEVKKIGEIKKKMSDLVEALMEDLKTTWKKNALLLAHWDAQSYNGEVFVDLYDLCDRLIARYNEFEITSSVIDKCGAMKTAIDDMVLRTCIVGNACQFSYGLSIYFPWAVLSPAYANLSFPRDTGWLDYLMSYHVETRRLPHQNAHVRDRDLPYRASVPTNKGRNGHVESMRNPPIGDVKILFEKPSELQLPPEDETAKAATRVG